MLLLLTPLMGWEWRARQVWFLVYLGNLPAIRDFSLYAVESSRSKVLTLFLGHLWSLCVEEQFYLVWPLLVFAARTRTRILRLALLVVALEFPLRFWVVTHASYADALNLMFRNLPFRADTLMAGAVLAMLLRGPAADRWQRGCKWIFLGALGMLLFLAARYPASSAAWQLSAGLTLVAVMCMGLVGAVLGPQSLWSRAFSGKALRVLGRYSYGFYLFHLLFLSFWYWLIGATIALVHSLVLGAGVAIAANFCVTFGLAKLSYDRLELPFLRRKTRFAYEIESSTCQHAFRLEP